MTSPENMEKAIAWHAVDAQQALDLLNADEHGLDASQVRERLARFGENSLPAPKRRSALERLAAQFHNVLIYVLLAAAVVTAFLGHWVDTFVIAGVVIINSLIGFVQEGKAERSLDAVRNLLSPRAAVLRNGHRMTLDAEQLVPGDIVFVQAGDRVPADLRLLQAKQLHIDEALLTGESAPVTKTVSPVSDNAVVGDRSSMAWSGTYVTRGQGSGLVVGTGAQTEIGRVNTLLASVQTLTTPLLRQMARFGHTLTLAIIVAATFTFVLGVWFRDYVMSDMFMAAVGLAVAAIPEGLPAIVTITLAIGVQRMAKRSAIIRRLPAVETLGSVTVICSDKTGTLTRNEMTVQSVIIARGWLNVSGVGYDPHGGFSRDDKEIQPEQFPALREISRAAALCNDASIHLEQDKWHVDGDPTEIALSVLAVKAGIDTALENEEYHRVDMIPFESEHRFMATLHHDHAGHAFIYIKGAPEVILARSINERYEGTLQALNTAYWEQEVQRIAGEGQRPLAIAFMALPDGTQTLNFSNVEAGLSLLGIVGIMDPPREEAIHAVSLCHQAGIEVKMITGDHAATATAIGQRIGIGVGKQALTGIEIDRMTPTELQQAVQHADVFARVSPEHKLRLVEALQANGEVAAMTGDGVNDAPALKRADVGIAMGQKGTEVAKESSEMVLADDNFSSIASAVEEGRTVYDNIKKSILFILPTNGGEALTILAAIALGRMLPVTPAQILWVNMVTAVTLALSLAFEPAEYRVMQRPPRDPRTPLLTRYMVWRILFVSMLMVVATFGLFVMSRNQGADIETARTLAVNTLVMLEVFYLFNSRYLIDSSLSRAGLLGNGYALIAVGSVVVFQLLFTYAPTFQALFHTRALPIESWWLILVAGLLLFILVEVEKAFVRILNNRNKR